MYKNRLVISMPTDHKMKIYTILTLGLMFFGLVANAQTDFYVSGELKGFEDNALVKIERENIVLDSCYLKGGKFVLSGSFELAPTPVHLTIDNGNDFVYSTLFIGNERIVIEANIEDFPFDLQTEGSAYDGLRYDFGQLEKDLIVQRDEHLAEMFVLREQGKWNDSLQNAYWGRSEPFGKIRAIDIELDKIREEFVDGNINSYYALYLLGVYKTEYPGSKISNLIEKLDPELKKSAYAKSIESHLINPDLSVGDTYYDFSAYNKNETQVKFSDFFQGKYVLLDFSTVYCGWCLKAIPALEEIKRSHNEMLEIVTFYVDKNPVGYEDLSQKHSDDWGIIWDKEGRLSDSYAKYKVFATPTFYLFDPNGTLVHKFDGYSEDLPEQIAKAVTK